MECVTEPSYNRIAVLIDFRDSTKQCLLNLDMCSQLCSANYEASAKQMHFIVILGLLVLECVFLVFLNLENIYQHSASDTEMPSLLNFTVPIFANVAAFFFSLLLHLENIKAPIFQVLTHFYKSVWKSLFTEETIML